MTAGKSNCSKSKFSDSRLEIIAEKIFFETFEAILGSKFPAYLFYQPAVEKAEAIAKEHGIEFDKENNEQNSYLEWLARPAYWFITENYIINDGHGLWNYRIEPTPENICKLRKKYKKLWKSSDNPENTLNYPKVYIVENLKKAVAYKKSSCL